MPERPFELERMGDLGLRNNAGYILFRIFGFCHGYNGFSDDEVCWRGSGRKLYSRILGRRAVAVLHSTSVLVAGNRFFSSSCNFNLKNCIAGNHYGPPTVVVLYKKEIFNNL